MGGPTRGHGRVAPMTGEYNQETSAVTYLKYIKNETMERDFLKAYSSLSRKFKILMKAKKSADTARKTTLN